MDIKEKTKITKVLYTKCRKCNKEIRGTKESQVIYNLERHEERCKEVKE